MIREKRRTTAPVPYEIPLICYPRKRKKKVKLEKCRYEPIPFPLKFAYVGGVYHFYGGISLQEDHGRLITQTVLLSQCFKCDEVQVIKTPEQRILSMKLLKLPVFEYPPWQPMVEALKDPDKPEINRWADVLQEYCINYEDKMRQWSNEESFRKQFSEAKLIKMNKESEKRIEEYFKKYPCINFRCQLDNGRMQFNEIIINENYLDHVGYTIDSFATTTLRDGLPQLLPNNNIDAVKVYLDNYCSAEKNDYQSPEFPADLTLRKGFARKVNFKAHYFTTYRDGTFGMDCIWIITNKQAPNFCNTLPIQPDLNHAFLKNAVSKEDQATQFLEQYYQTSFNAKYTNIDKAKSNSYKIKPYLHSWPL